MFVGGLGGGVHKSEYYPYCELYVTRALCYDFLAKNGPNSDLPLISVVLLLRFGDLEIKLLNLPFS